MLPFASVLVTGAGGFVGHRLVAALHEALPAETRLVVGARAPMGHAVEHIDLDVTDATCVDAVIADLRPQLIVHLAALSSVGASAGAGPACWTVNLQGSLHLAAAVRAHVPDATVLFTSTAEVYGRTFNDGVATEDSPLRPASVYARTKAAAEAMLNDVLPETARLMIVRPSNHSGLGQDTRFVLPAFAEQIARIEAGYGEPIVHVGNLDAERDFLHVDDVVAAYLALLSNASVLPYRSTFNVASGRMIRIGALLDRLLALSRLAIKVEQDPARMRASDVPCAALSAAALRDAIGWRPERDIDSLVAEVLVDQRRRVTSE